MKQHLLVKIKFQTLKDEERFREEQNSQLKKVANDIFDIILGDIDDNNISLLMKFANNVNNKKQYERAFEYYELAAEANYAEAQYSSRRRA